MLNLILCIQGRSLEQWYNQVDESKLICIKGDIINDIFGNATFNFKGLS